jgi:ankyrin repeat protein
MGTVLHESAAVGDVARLRRLVELGANVESQGEGVGRPLHYAATHGRVEAMVALVELGADVEAPGRMGRSALAYAAQVRLCRDRFSATDDLGYKGSGAR